MARYRRRYRSSGPYRPSRSSGAERAREHIAAARRLSDELGGAEKQVKEWFFSLPKGELDRILQFYGNDFGTPAKTYAEDTIHKWKSGQVKMGGMVAERLFKLLPAFMPPSTRYEITEKLWHHLGPSSRRKLWVGPDVDIPTLEAKVRDEIDRIVFSYRIPDTLQERFDWLSADDVGIKQDLLNHMRELDKALAIEAARIQIPILIQQLKSDAAGHMQRLAQVLLVGKHELELEVHRRVTGIQETGPDSPETTRSGFSLTCVILAIVIIIFFLLVKR